MKLCLQTGAHYNRLTNGYMRYLNKNNKYLSTTQFWSTAINLML